MKRSAFCWYVIVLLISNSNETSQPKYLSVFCVLMLLIMQLVSFSETLMNGMIIDSSLNIGSSGNLTSFV